MNHCARANKNPSPANPTPNTISRLNHDESKCRITFSECIRSPMWNLDAINPNTLPGPIAYNAVSVIFSTVPAANLRPATTCTIPNTTNAPTLICAARVNTIIGSSAVCMSHSSSGLATEPVPEPLGWASRWGVITRRGRVIAGSGNGSTPARSPCSARNSSTGP